MVLQYTYLARALLCAWVAEGHDFAIQSRVNLYAILQTERAPTTQVSLPKVSLHLSLGSMRFVQQAQSSLSVPDNFMGEKKPKKVEWISSSSRPCMFSIWAHKISLSCTRENLGGADTVPKRSAEALINPSMGRPEARRKILVSSTDTLGS